MGVEVTKDDLNSKANWDDRFSHNGRWEKNNGRSQTRIFAEGFNRVINMPFDHFSLLDVGCALGDAIPVFKNKYPHAILSGCDFSATGIERCVKDYGGIASFFASSIENINGKWDAIYCSNVLEHFHNPVQLAQQLLGNCRILYLMLPYKELENRQPLTSASNNQNGHIYSFFMSSFNTLLENGPASAINTTILGCPGAWGWTFQRKVLHVISAIRHWHRFDEIFIYRKQIIFEIHGKNS